MNELSADTVGSIVAYESMCRWIAESESMAECKDISDKAAALREYAKRIKNTDAERRAANVRLIAERRFGELLKELARHQTVGLLRGGPSPDEAETALNGLDVKHTSGPLPKRDPSPYAQALADTGISTQSAHRYQALAAVPQPVFDEALSDPASIPTAAGLLAKAEARRAVQEARDPVPQMPSDTLWLWGRLRDLERDGFFDKDLNALLDGLTETMRADVLRIAPLATGFFTRLEEVINHELA